MADDDIRVGDYVHCPEGYGRVTRAGASLSVRVSWTEEIVEVPRHRAQKAAPPEPWPYEDDGAPE